MRNCRGCMLVSVPAPPEPMKRRDLPSEPWRHLAIDFLGPLPSQNYLFVVVDYFSRYKEVEIMSKIDATEAIKRLKVICARFGYPYSITLDNGRQFIAEEFRSFCTEYNVKLIYTAPYWPQQNGEVERQNRSLLKRLIISQNTGKEWKTDLTEYLLMYRSTPHSTTNKTPAELMFGRNIRDKIPQITQPLEVDEEVLDRDKEKKEKGKRYADKKRLARRNSIVEGDRVLVKVMNKNNKLSPNFHSEEFVITKRNGTEVMVKSDSGKEYRRSINHVKRVPQAEDKDERLETNKRSRRNRVPPVRFQN